MARSVSDQRSEVAMGCCIGQASIVAEGLGLWKGWRAAAVGAVAGCQGGVGGGARKEDAECDPLGRLRALAEDAEAGAAPGHGVAEEQEDGEGGDRVRRA